MICWCMPELTYKSYIISVSTERATGKWAPLTPMVKIRRLKNDPQPFFIIMTSQFFRSENESDVCGISLGKQWIDEQAQGI
jgi:hypothetical protein